MYQDRALMWGQGGQPMVHDRRDWSLQQERHRASDRRIGRTGSIPTRHHDDMTGGMAGRNNRSDWVDTVISVHVLGLGLYVVLREMLQRSGV